MSGREDVRVFVAEGTTKESILAVLDQIREIIASPGYCPAYFTREAIELQGLADHLDRMAQYYNGGSPRRDAEEARADLSDPSTTPPATVPGRAQG